MNLATAVANKVTRQELIGESPPMNALRDDINTAARTHAKVMVLGETGVGKEVVARMIHEKSTRAMRPFVAVNCSGVPETLLESELFGHTRGSFTGAYRDKPGLVRHADRGTLFLDELGEMSLRMQATLLRFTETGEVQQVGADTPGGRVDVRLITATNRDLGAMMADGGFRQDLFYRLNVIQIRIPALRERGDDILILIQHYLERFAAQHRLPVPAFTVETDQSLLAYQWPGNVRELRNVAERLVLLDRGRRLEPHDLPAEVRGAPVAPTAAAEQPATDPSESAMSGAAASERVERLWQRLRSGEDFWNVVRPAFKAHELTRSELVVLIDRGLTETHGSYRALVSLFNLPAGDYKRFHGFLYQQRCNLAVAPYRQASRRRGGTVPQVDRRQPE